MRFHPAKILLLRRRHVACLAALAMAAVLFGVVTWPAAVSAGTTKRQLPIYSVERSQPLCSISFDAAWGNEDTQLLIDILAKYNVKTTFFVVGDWVDKFPESVKALHDAGHEVMNHSNHHDHYNSLTADEIVAAIEGHYTFVRVVEATESGTMLKGPITNPGTRVETLEDDVYGRFIAVATFMPDGLFTQTDYYLRWRTDRP